MLSSDPSFLIYLMEVCVSGKGFLQSHLAILKFSVASILYISAGETPKQKKPFRCVSQWVNSNGWADIKSLKIIFPPHLFLIKWCIIHKCVLFNYVLQKEAGLYLPLSVLWAVTSCSFISFCRVHHYICSISNCWLNESPNLEEGKFLLWYTELEIRKLDYSLSSVF